MLETIAPKIEGGLSDAFLNFIVWRDMDEILNPSNGKVVMIIRDNYWLVNEEGQVGSRGLRRGELAYFHNPNLEFAQTIFPGGLFVKLPLAFTPWDTSISHY